MQKLIELLTEDIAIDARLFLLGTNYSDEAIMHAVPDGDFKRKIVTHLTFLIRKALDEEHSRLLGEWLKARREDEMNFEEAVDWMEIELK